MKQTFNGRSLVVSVLVAFLCLPLATGQQLDVDKLKEMKARSIGPAGMSGRVTAIDAVVSNPDIIYIGTASGGVWKSESGGISWEPVFDKEKLINIGALAITQSNPDVIWVGTGEGNPRNSLNLGAGIFCQVLTHHDAYKKQRSRHRTGTESAQQVTTFEQYP